MTCPQELPLCSGLWRAPASGSAVSALLLGEPPSVAHVDGAASVFQHGAAYISQVTGQPQCSPENRLQYFTLPSAVDSNYSMVNFFRNAKNRSPFLFIVNLGTMELVSSMQPVMYIVSIVLKLE